MSLSTNELERARTAFREITVIKQQKRFWFMYGALFLNSFIQVLRHYHEIWIKWSQLGLMILMLSLGVYRWMDNRRVGNRYAGNVELLRVLDEREPGLTDRLDVSLDTHPLLEAWNRRLGRRALLWRLDRFLSGKGWPSH